MALSDAEWVLVHPDEFPKKAAEFSNPSGCKVDLTETDYDADGEYVLAHVGETPDRVITRSIREDDVLEADREDVATLLNQRFSDDRTVEGWEELFWSRSA